MKSKKQLLENNILDSMGLFNDTVLFFLRPVLVMQEPCMNLCLKIQVNDHLNMETVYSGEWGIDMNLSVFKIRKHLSDPKYGCCYSLETCMNLTDIIVGVPFVATEPEDLIRFKSIEISWCVQAENEEEIILIDRYEMNYDRQQTENGRRFTLDAITDFQKRISHQQAAINKDGVAVTSGILDKSVELQADNYDGGCLKTGIYYHADYYVDFKKHNANIRLHS